MTELPENLADLTIDEISELVDTLEAEFDAAVEEDVPLADLTAIGDRLLTAREAHGSAVAAVEQENEQRAELIAKLRSADDDTDAEVEVDDDPEAAADDISEPVADADPVEDAPEADSDVEAAVEPEPVAASARKRASASAVRRTSPAPKQPATKAADDIVITAAADIPGVSNGSALSKLDVAKSMHRKARGLSDGSGRIPIASVKSGTPDEYRLEDRASQADIDAVVASLTQVESVDALIAAGWCAPSETLYETFGIEAAENIFELPTLSTSRGGLQIPSYIGIDSIAGGLFSWTEAYADYVPVAVSDVTVAADGTMTITTATDHGIEVGASVEISGNSTTYDGVWLVDTVPSATTLTVSTELATDAGPNAGGTLFPVKGCATVPCPEWHDCRLDADGICITAGNLTNQAYPEGTQRTIDLAMTAHMHRVGNQMLQKVIAGADAVTIDPMPSDVASDLLHGIAVSVADYRSQHLIGSSTVLEGVFPLWSPDAIRSTLAARAGVDHLSVTDTQILDWFRNYGVRPQFVLGYQTMYSGTPATGFPGTLEFLLYPAGGFVAVEGGSIDLGIVRDSTLNKTNDYTAAWSEQTFCVGQRGPNARAVTVTSDVDGRTGGPEFLGV